MVLNVPVQKISHMTASLWKGVIMVATASHEDVLIRVAQWEESSFRQQAEKKQPDRVCPKGICDGIKCTPCLHAISDYIDR